jgi:RimJ/RimL family protein N-acetyltransferase
MTSWAFDSARALRIVLIIDVANASSEPVAARCGYTREGVLRSLRLKQDKRIDAAIWSRLPSDPPAPPSGSTDAPASR